MEPVGERWLILLSVVLPSVSSLLYFSLFAVSYFSYFAVIFFLFSKTHALSHTIFHFSYQMKPVCETSLIIMSLDLWNIIRQYFSSYISAGISSLLRTSVQPLSSLLRASELPSATSTLLSLELPTFVRFLTFLYWVLSLSYFSHFALSCFSYFSVTFFSS